MLHPTHAKQQRTSRLGRSNKDALKSTRDSDRAGRRRPARQIGINNTLRRRAGGGYEPKSKTLLHFGDKVKGFNYGSLPPSVANEAREAAAKIRKAGDNYQYCAGEYLAAIRSKLEHGHWLAWLELELGFSDQVARNYMAYYEFAQRYSLDVAGLFLANVIYRLASAPQPVQKQLIARAKTGESITLLDVRRAHDAYRPRRPVLKDSGDIQHEDTPDRVGEGIEIDAGDVETVEESDEKAAPTADPLYGVALDVGAQLIDVLRNHPTCDWFQKALSALICNPVRCREALVHAHEGLAIARQRRGKLIEQTPSESDTQAFESEPAGGAGSTGGYASGQDGSGIPARR